MSVRSILPNESTMQPETSNKSYSSLLSNLCSTWNNKTKSWLELQTKQNETTIATHEAMCKKNEMLTLAQQHEHGGLLEAYKTCVYRFQSLESNEKINAIVQSMVISAFFATWAYIAYKGYTGCKTAAHNDLEENENEEKTVLITE